MKGVAADGLPRPRQTSATMPALTPFSAPLQSPHILVMDADLEVLEQTGRMLSGHGFVITLSSTWLSPDTVASLRPDVIVLDPAMPLPVADDPATHGSDRQLPSLQQVPVICQTARQEMARAMLGSGIPTLLKPCEARELLTLVHECADDVAEVGIVHPGIAGMPHQIGGVQ